MGRRVAHGEQHAADGREIGGRMLHVEQHPVEARRGGALGCRQRR